MEVTDDRKRQVVKHILVASPPGQFTDVLKDVKKLTAAEEELLADEHLAGMARSFHVNTGKVVEYEDMKFVLTKYGEVDKTHYLNPHDGTVVEVDHIKGEVVGPAGDDVEVPAYEDAVEGMRSTLQGKMIAYLMRYYKGRDANGAGGVYVAAENGNVHVVISGERLNLRNFWSGSWLSDWKVENATGSACTVSGHIKIRCHYFEEGNVQLKTVKEVSAKTVSGDSDDVKAQAVMEYVEEQESLLQTSLESMYLNMSDETFKAMRRILPVTQTKFDWNLHNHKLARNLPK